MRSRNRARMSSRLGLSTDRVLGLIIGAAVVFFGLGYYLRQPPTVAPETAQDSAPQAANGVSNESGSTDPAIVTLPNWASAGVRMEPAKQFAFNESIRLTGRVSLNEDQISHIFPMVEGSVDQVHIGLGQVVKANDVLVVVHSRVVGQAKLELYQARLALEMANVKDEMQREIAKNTRELLVALRNNEKITDIETTFRNRSMGEYRERLLLAYSAFAKSDAELQRLESVGLDGAISGKQLASAKSARNADLATFQARIEQVDFEIQTVQILSEQSVKEAATRVAVAEANLKILGCEDQDIQSIDPKTQGESISDYSIRAPIGGTVISKDVTLREQVRPDAQILSIADLSTVWITADIYEQNVPLLNSLAGKPIRVHNEAWPDKTFEAQIFYTGEIMDEKTRTISMRAVAQNHEHLLKPGMFVTINLSGPAGQASVLQVPKSAVLEHQGEKFVFIHEGGDKFKRRDVKVGQSNDQFSCISHGVSADEAVVVEGGFVLKSRMLSELMGEE